MKLVSAMREGISALGAVLLTASVRVISWPLTASLMTRDSRFFVVIGREDGRFIDNAKYFFSWLHANLPSDHQVFYISENAEVVQTIRAAGARAERYPSLASLKALLRAGTIILDSAEGVGHGRIGLFRFARLVQLWHGAPLKEIELAQYRRRLATLGTFARWLVKQQKRVLGRYPLFDVVVSTSKFFSKRAFAQCFHARSIIACGYPRNDVLYGGAAYPAQLVSLNVDLIALEQLNQHRLEGGKVVLYAPTFRKERGSPFAEGWIDLAALSELAGCSNIVIALKLHPVMRGTSVVSQFPGIVSISPESDVYPLLAEVDVLVTDYSSIYFDFLLLDRPIVFYAYDYENYVANDRSLLFDYEVMTPGEKVRDPVYLLEAIIDALDNKSDKWRSEREKVRSMVFDHLDDQASARLFAALSRHQ